MTSAEVRAARTYLDNLTDERAVQLHRWLDQRGGRIPEVDGQLSIDDAGVSTGR